jgi:hypothetical protein
MAKVKSNEGIGKRESSKRKRPGIHSKKKDSKLKTSKNYKKKYVGQG